MGSETNTEFFENGLTERNKRDFLNENATERNTLVSLHYELEYPVSKFWNNWVLKLNMIC